MEEDLKKEVEKEAEKEYKCNCTHGAKNRRSNMSSNDCVYGLGLIGAAIYYISTATSFWIGALGILKAIVWPAFLVYELLKFLIK